MIMPKRRRDEDETESQASAGGEDVEMKDGDTNHQATPSKRRTLDVETPSKQATAADTPSKQRSILKTAHGHVQSAEGTPKSLRKVLFSTPARPLDDLDDQLLKESPLTAAHNADRSARRKSARRLFDPQEADDFGGENDAGLEDALAREILDSEAEEDQETHEDTTDVAPGTPSKTPRPRGRPKGSKRQLSPTPHDLPPHELYFFQNRTGGVKTSTNTLASGALLNHDDYFAQIHAYKDPHEPDKQFLADLHANSYDQWLFELHQGFNICLYGYGSKRDLLMDFADHIFDTSEKKPIVVVINGYTPSLSLRDVLATISKNLLPSPVANKLPLQPTAWLDALLTTLTATPPTSPFYLLIHSLDAPPLRKPQLQTALSKLASHPSISLISTTDTPVFPLLWDISHLQSYRFLFHDTTTFAPYTSELDAVEEVNALLDRSGRRIGGKDGVTYVLRSLPENARNLFRILVAEQLALLETTEHLTTSSPSSPLGFSDPEPTSPSEKRPRKRGRPAKKQKPVVAPTPRKRTEQVVGVEYRTLYHKAVEEFVCSSEMSFRTLLKEFHDHDVVESRKDALGTERLGVPFGKEELEELLEELV